MQGLLLDLDAATLTVWVNGERKGVMVHPGMTDEGGRPVGRLEGPLRWVVGLGRTSVAIDGPLPPPVVTVEDLAEDERGGASLSSLRLRHPSPPATRLELTNLTTS